MAVRRQHVRFFFNDAPTTEIYTLSLHDALPISANNPTLITMTNKCRPMTNCATDGWRRSEEHTSNSSHSQISYAVFCLKKKKRWDVTAASSTRAATTRRAGSW